MTTLYFVVSWKMADMPMDVIESKHMKLQLNLTELIYHIWNEILLRAVAGDGMCVFHWHI